MKTIVVNIGKCIRCLTCGDPESFVRGGPNLITFFFKKVDEGIEDPNVTINGPSSARQRKAILNGVSLAGG